MKSITAKVTAASASDIRALCNFQRDTKDRMSYPCHEGHYTVYLLYASWNTNLTQQWPTGAADLTTTAAQTRSDKEADVMKAHGHSVKNWFCDSEKIDQYFGNTNTSLKFFDIEVQTVKVDQDDETMDLCVGDKHDTNKSLDSVLHVPSELPAIIFVDKNFQKIKYYPINIDSKQLTDCLIHCHSSPYLPSLNRAIKDRLMFSMISLLRTNIPLGECSTNVMTSTSQLRQMKSTNRSQLNAIRIFITGDRSQVGKSSVCLGLIGTLLTKHKFSPSSLAYIKPATQCEESQLIAKYCEKHNIDNVPIGPIVYYKGFTRAFLDGETDDTKTLLHNAKLAVDKLAMNKRIIIIDGVGYPAVGSICGTDNVSVAKACGYEIKLSDGKREIIPPAVLIVGKRGVGDAIDSYNLNATYFKAQNVKVMGAIFNRLPNDKNHYYSLENCKKAVTSYFAKTSNDEDVFGFIPEVEGLSASSMESADQFINVFANHVDVSQIIQVAKNLRNSQVRCILQTSLSQKRLNDDTTDTMRHSGSNDHVNGHVQKKKKISLSSSPSSLPPSLDASEANGHTSISSKVNGSKKIRLTREQIENTAKSQGAAGG